MATELRPCAHCGSSRIDIIKQEGRYSDDMYSVTCDECGIQTPYCDFEITAIAAWNKRAGGE